MNNTKHLFTLLLLLLSWIATAQVETESPNYIPDWKIERFTNALVEIDEYGIDAKDTLIHRKMGLPDPSLRDLLQIRPSHIETNDFNIYTWTQSDSHKLYLFTYESKKSFFVLTERYDANKILKHLNALIEAEGYELPKAQEKFLNALVNNIAKSNLKTRQY